MSNNAFNSKLIVNAEPEDYSKVINHLVASSLVGHGILWPRSEFVQPHRPGYFKPDTNLYRDTVRKDRRNGKELEYIHSTGTWIEQSICALDLFKQEKDPEKQGRLLSILEDCLRASKEILAMRTSHFHAVIHKGPAIARHLADIVKAKAEAAYSSTGSSAYTEVYSELSERYVIESAKSIARNEAEIKKVPDKTFNKKE